MTKTNSFLKGAALTGAALTLGLLSTAPVHAFTFAPGKTSVTVEASDINKSFTVEFDGNVERQNVTRLTAEAIFTFLGFTTVGSNTEAKFDVSLKNTSSGGITSRVSALGFNVSQALLGVGNADGDGNTRVSGLFSNDRTGSFPNNFGDINVCFTEGNTCQGGSNGGVTTGNTGLFTPILAFTGSVDSFTLSNFGVRYQSIGGTNLGDSGTGRGQVPTPALLPGLLALGAGAWRKRKGEQAAQAKAEV
ncbi:cistern family PEP-CTERM protein [Phormidium sp. FACHB-592]|uniref:Cistern family PEP-CTERM protein n=1 Tax=Stenomitos frigidus AS-A4 TaxID=2933935 RepID=A0ABV0KJR8_9CYAN|nr:cistern family PEP-CTERM protein [Phormidium sp. FACHB-592]MBD2072704.1 cistern family PEP-CTERM protein [Phormidium sp. FACHB-592]